MTTITRGTIKSYNPVTHRAAVQLAGSLAVWLDALPVSDAIEPPEVVAGRECGVLFFGSEDNPDDAAIISVHNAVPLGTNRMRDADADTRVEVERTANENKIALTVAGTLRYLVQAASPHHDMTGDLQVRGSVAIGNTSPAPLTGAALRLDASNAGASTLDGLFNVIRGLSGSTGALRGVTGEVVVQSGAGALAYARGLEFKVQHDGSSTITDLLGSLVLVNGTGPSTNRVGQWVQADALDTTATLRAGFLARLAPSVLATYADWKSYVSRVNLFRSTITDLFHYAVEDATLLLGAVVTTVYGYYSPNLVVGSNKLPFYDGGIGGNKNDTSGNRFRSNTQFGSTTGAFGTGDGVIGIANAPTVPTTNPAGGGILYASAGQLVWRGSAGTVTVIAPA